VVHVPGVTQIAQQLESQHVRRYYPAHDLAANHYSTDPLFNEVTARPHITYQLYDESEDDQTVEQHLADIARPDDHAEGRFSYRLVMEKSDTAGSY